MEYGSYRLLEGSTMQFSRRDFVQLVGTSALVSSPFLKAQSSYIPETLGASNSAAPAKVALVKGENRRKNIYEALVSIDDQILPGLKRKTASGNQAKLRQRHQSTGRLPCRRTRRNPGLS